jgi:nicotinate-nucleotide adenylyltransferase
MTDHKFIGLFGGSFDPVHSGHLYLAQTIYQQLNLQELRFIPCQKAVLDKTLQATAEQRLTMLQLALQEYAEFTIDQRELQRVSPSYTVDTLFSLRAELGDQVSFAFIIGSDALQQLNRWYRWQTLIELTHLIVVPRPNYELPTHGVMGEFMQRYQTDNVKLLQQNAAGCLFVAKLEPMNISATMIRQCIAAGLSLEGLLPSNVLKFIQQENIYRS